MIYDDKWILVDFGISFPDETDLGIDVLLPDYEFIKSLGEKAEPSNGYLIEGGGGNPSRCGKGVSF